MCVFCYVFDIPPPAMHPPELAMDFWEWKQIHILLSCVIFFSREKIPRLARLSDVNAATALPPFLKVCIAVSLRGFSVLFFSLVLSFFIILVMTIMCMLLNE